MCSSWVAASPASPRPGSSAVAAGACWCWKLVSDWAARAWVSSFAGVDVEMGGAFVHWSQPHLWAEVTRYGLGIVELPEADRAFLRRDDGVEELDAKVFAGPQRSVRTLCAGTEAYLAGTDVDPPERGRGGGGSRLDRRAHRRARPRSAAPGPASTRSAPG